MHIYYSNTYEDFTEAYRYIFKRKNKHFILCSVIAFLLLWTTFSLLGAMAYKGANIHLSLPCFSCIAGGILLHHSTALRKEIVRLKKLRTKPFRNTLFFRKLSYNTISYPIKGQLLYSNNVISYTSLLYKKNLTLDIGDISAILDNKQSNKLYLIDKHNSLLPIIHYNNFSCEKERLEFVNLLKKG